MKKNLFSVMMLAVAGLFAACDGGDDNNLKITLDPPSITGIKYQGDEKTVNIDSPVDWEIVIADADKKWLSVKPESGKAGNATITFTIGKNMEGSRSADVVIKGNGASVTVKVGQDAYAGNAPKIAVTDATKLPLELYIENPNAETTQYDWFKDGKQWNESGGFKPAVRADDGEDEKSAVNVYVKGSYTVKGLLGIDDDGEYVYTDESLPYVTQGLGDFYVTLDGFKMIFDQEAAATDETKEYYAIKAADLEGFDFGDDDMCIEGNYEEIALEFTEAGTFKMIAVEAERNTDGDLELTGRVSNEVTVVVNPQ